MICKRDGANSRNQQFFCDGNTIEIVNRFNYLGIAFTTGGAFYT